MRRLTGRFRGIFSWYLNFCIVSVSPVRQFVCLLYKWISSTHLTKSGRMLLKRRCYCQFEICWPYYAWEKYVESRRLWNWWCGQYVSCVDVETTNAVGEVVWSRACCSSFQGFCPYEQPETASRRRCWYMRASWTFFFFAGISRLLPAFGLPPFAFSRIP